MAFDGIIVCAAAKELSGHLEGGRVEKIYQPEADELIFHIHSKQAKYKLYISSGSNYARFHLLTMAIENRQTPFAFCMLLRKHLAGGRITGISQKDSERILEINFEAVGELGDAAAKTLIVEVMGKHSNIILIDASTRRIIDSIKRISLDESRVRQVLPGKAYEYPPSQGKTPFKDIRKEDIDALSDCPPHSLSKSLLGGIQGLSPAMAERLAASDDIYGELDSMRRALESGEFKPSVYLDGAGAPVDFHIFAIPELEGSCEKVEFDDVSQCVESFYFNKAGSNRVKQKRDVLERSVKTALDKLYLKKQRLAEDILNAEKADLFRLYGELLTSNLHLLKPGSHEAALTNYYDGSQVVIPLDKRLSPSKNAQSYYKKYSKAKTTIREKTLRLHENDKAIEYLDTVNSYIENAASAEDIEALRTELSEEGYLRNRSKGKQSKPAKGKLAPFSYSTSGGFRVLAGRNNKENDSLTFKTAARSDIWLHTKDIPGSHVILFADGGAPSETDIHEAARIAAFHSKGKHSENVPVDYTFVKYVKKPAGAKPGMVIFTNNKTVFVNPTV